MKPQQYFGKVCKWMGQCLGCTDMEFLDYNTYEVHSFMGLVGYYRRFVEDSIS